MSSGLEIGITRRAAPTSRVVACARLKRKRCYCCMLLASAPASTLVPASRLQQIVFHPSSPFPARTRVCSAAAAEAAPLIERLGLAEDPDKFSAAAPSKCFSGSYKGATINVVTNGKCARFGVDQIGTVAAGLSTWLSVEVSNICPFDEDRAFRVFRKLYSKMPCGRKA